MENFLLLLHEGCTLYLSENVLLTVYCVVFGGVNSLRSRPALECRRGQAGTAESSRDNKKVRPEDDPAGSKHVGVCYD
jgi:hypothetical protein